MSQAAGVESSSDTLPLPCPTSADSQNHDAPAAHSPVAGPETDPQTRADQTAPLQTDTNHAPSSVLASCSERDAPDSKRSSQSPVEGEASSAPDSKRSSQSPVEGEASSAPDSKRSSQSPVEGEASSAQTDVPPLSPQVTEDNLGASEDPPLVILEPTPLAVEVGRPDQPVEDASPDPGTFPQHSDPQATSPPEPDRVQLPPHSGNTPQPELDAGRAQPVDVPRSGKVEAAPTPSESPAQTRPERKSCAEVAVVIEKPSPYSPGLNGSAQLSAATAAASADCSQLESEDCTPLLSRHDSQSPPASPSPASTSSPTARGRRSRFPGPVKIPVPEDCLRSKRMATSLEDITSLRLWKGIIAEFVGVLLLVLVGCGSCLSLDEGSSSSVVQIALCFGLSVATIVWNIGHISGGHINPAVTLALLATRKISLAKAVFFVLFQLLGAVVGAGILMGLTPTRYQGTLGSTLVSKELDPGKGLGVEIVITFVLVFTVFASIDSKRRDLNGSTPLTIGLSVAMCHLFAIQYTGASMNTARSFGPALVTGKWDNHWVYWVGPITGGVVAGLLYEYLFAVNASLTKVRACVLSSDYDDNKFRAKKIKVRIVEEEDDPEATTETLALTPSDGQATIEDP